VPTTSKKATLSAPDRRLRLDTKKGRAFLAELARFAAGDGSPQYSGTSLAYHAAQDTRLRDYTGGYLGLRSRPEEDMLRNYDRSKIIARGRLMFRNNPYLSALLLAYVQEIGTPTYKSTARLADPDKTKAYNESREAFMHGYFIDCESDRALSLDQLIEIWNFEDCIAGEMFVVKLRNGDQQLIPSELCGSANFAAAPIPASGTWQDGTPLPTGATERDGLVRDSSRKLIGYRFAVRDPITSAVYFTPDQSVVVPEQYVWHLYDPDRVEQRRGVPKLAPILNPLLDVYETAGARTQQVKNQACLSMWIEKNLDPYGFAESMRGALRTGDVNTAVTLETAAAQRSSYQDIRAGSIYYGATGEKPTLIEPKPNAQDFHDHYIDLLQVCSACLNGMPIEVGLEGFRMSNYSSARATMNKWRRNVLRKRDRIEQKYADPLQLWQTNRAELFGDLEKIPAEQKAKCHWGWPAIPDIDGTKTALQNSVELATGATNLRTIYADKGKHYEVEIHQLVEEKGEFLEMFIARGERAGLTHDQAVAWALTQVPSDVAASRAVAALITSDGPVGDGTPAGEQPATGAPAPIPPKSSKKAK